MTWGANLGTPKTENSTDLTHNFFGMDSNSFSIKYKLFGRFFLGGGQKDKTRQDMTKRHFLGLGGMAGLAPLDPTLFGVAI